MAKKKRTKAGSRKNAVAIGLGAATAGPPGSEEGLPRVSPPRRWCAWGSRFALVTLSPLLFFVLAEAGLRILGYGRPTNFFVKMQGGQSYTANSKFGWQFYPRETSTQPHPFLMSARKAEGTKRIFILGESAAAGTPDPAFGFARILAVMLRRQYPKEQFEIINAAMRGINSHIILPIARECAGQDPDLFIIYAGNNEAIGLYAPEPGVLNLTPYLRLLRFGQRIKSTRLAQAMESVLRSVRRRDAAQAPKQNMDFFRSRRLAADDPQRQAVYANFRANLSDICEVTRKSGAKTILSTIAVNLKDFPPLASLHRANLTETERVRWDAAYSEAVAAEKRGLHQDAIHHYLGALQLDDRFAELHFRLARCYWATSQFENARKHFGLARDWDAMQFRTDSRMNAIIRDLASGRESEGTYLVDIERAFADSPLSEQRIPGSKLFSEHVHFMFDGDYVLAQTLFPTVTVALGLDPARNQVLSRQECADAMAFTEWDEYNIASAMMELSSKAPFLDQLEHAETNAKAQQQLAQRLAQVQQQDPRHFLSVYQKALLQWTNDWQLHHNFGGILYDLKDYSAAADQFETVVKLLPNYPPMRLRLGDALSRAGKFDDALTHVAEALRIDPDYSLAREALANIESQRRQKPQNPAITERSL